MNVAHIKLVKMNIEEYWLVLFTNKQNLMILVFGGMEFFGVTLSGYGNYISEVMREDYTEPKKVPNVEEVFNERLRLNPRLSISEACNKVDPILGIGNGFSYGSYQRLRLQTRKGLTKPVGPRDMYRVPVTTGQDWGFWQNDEILMKENWTRTNANYKMKSSELAKYAPYL